MSNHTRYFVSINYLNIHEKSMKWWYTNRERNEVDEIGHKKKFTMLVREWQKI